MHGRNAFAVAFHTSDLAIDETHTAFAGDLLKHIDEALVLDVEGMPGLDVGSAIFLTTKNLVGPHQCRGQMDVGIFFLAIKSMWLRQVTPLCVQLRGKGVVEASARAPQEFDAKFPCRSRPLVEELAGNTEILEKVDWKIRGGSLTHSDDADVGAAYDADFQIRDFSFQR